MARPEFAIRPASRGDLEILAALGARTFRDTYSPGHVSSEVEDYIASHFTVPRFAAQIEDPPSPPLLATVEGLPIGYAQLRVGAAPACVHGPRPIELARLYLERAAIGKGHGAALLEAALEEAHRHGFQTMWLGVWEGNLQARAFYRKQGFKEVGTHDFLFGGRRYPDPVMERPVGTRRERHGP